MRLQGRGRPQAPRVLPGHLLSWGRELDVHTAWTERQRRDPRGAPHTGWSLAGHPACSDHALPPMTPWISSCPAHLKPRCGDCHPNVARIPEALCRPRAARDPPARDRPRRWGVAGSDPALNHVTSHLSLGHSVPQFPHLGGTGEDGADLLGCLEGDQAGAQRSSWKNPQLLASELCTGHGG